MSLQTSGTMKMSDMNTLFGAPNGTPMSSYLYRGGGYSAFYDPSNVLIPASGPISFSSMYGARKNYFHQNSTACTVLGGYTMAPWGYSPPGGEYDRSLDMEFRWSRRRNPYRSLDSFLQSLYRRFDVYCHHVYHYR